MPRMLCPQPTDAHGLWREIQQSSDPEVFLSRVIVEAKQAGWDGCMQRAERLLSALRAEAA